MLAWHICICVGGHVIVDMQCVFSVRMHLDRVCAWGFRRQVQHDPGASVSRNSLGRMSVHGVLCLTNGLHWHALILL